MLSTLFLLSIGFTAFAHNDTPKKPVDSSALIRLNNIDSPTKIFFQDDENEVLFIDFDLVLDEIVAINILRAEALMMEDDVRDLPDNTIYEINFDIIRSGTYVIEVVTSEGNAVRKEIEVE